MKETKHIINNELKKAGQNLSLINPFSSEKRFKITNKLSKKVKGKLNDNKIQVSQVFLTRQNGSLMRVLMYRPADLKNNVPGVLWLHGGGYAMGSPEMEVNKVKQLMYTHECVVIVPAYTLSLEAPYPAALEDAYQTLVWLKDNAIRLSVNPSQLMVGGVSAGGGLSVALSLYARDKGKVSIAFLMPLYPMLDDRMHSNSATNNTAPLWNSTSNKIAWKLYLGDLFDSDHVPIYAAPSRATDFSKLPPTVTFVGDLEPFKDETIEYVTNLKKAGVPVEFEVYQGCYHAFDVINPKATISKNATAFFLSHFKYACAHYYTK